MEKWSTKDCSPHLEISWFYLEDLPFSIVSFLRYLFDQSNSIIQLPKLREILLTVIILFQIH